MAAVTITMLQLVTGGRPHISGWTPILMTAILWGASVFVIAWPLSSLMRRGFHPWLAWLEASLFWAAPLIWLIRLLTVEMGYG